MLDSHRGALRATLPAASSTLRREPTPFALVACQDAIPNLARRNGKPLARRRQRRLGARRVGLEAAVAALEERCSTVSVSVIAEPDIAIGVRSDNTPLEGITALLRRDDIRVDRAGAVALDAASVCEVTFVVHSDSLLRCV